MLEINPLYYDVPQAHLVAAIDAQLEQLDKAGAILSSGVNSRVQEYRNRLEDLRKRLHVARRKIEKIAQSRAGIVIYSAGSYPVPREKQEENFERLFPLTPLEPVRELEAKYRPPTYSSKLSEGLKFLHVKPPQSSVDENVFKLPPKGLGSFHQRGIKNVADLLLFNTGINPYSEELPTPEPNPTPVEEETAPPSTMGTSLSFPSQLGDENVDGFLYDPGRSTTAQLILPDNLIFGESFVTDLPDLQPSGQHQSSFAPSPMFSPTSPTDVFQQPLERNDMDNLPQLPGAFDSEMTLPDIAPPPAPPMPPPMPVAPVVSAVTTPPPVPPPIPGSSNAPSAPVPPPAPPSQTAPVAPPPPKSTPSPAGDRASLLDSIRNHGGLGRLRSVKDSNRKPKQQPEKPARAPKLDHMAQLKERLQRIGEISAGGPRQRSADVTPPPPPPRSEPKNIMEELFEQVKSKDIVGSDSDESDKEKDDSEWD